MQFDSTRKVVEGYLGSIYESTKEGSLEAIPRISGHGKDIKIKNVTVINSNGQAGNNIMFGEPFSVEVEVVAYKELRDLSVVIGIDSSSSYRISTVASEFAGRLFDVLQGSGFRARAFFDNLCLNPGRYTVTVSIRVGKEGLDQVINAGWFDVVDAAYSDAATVTGLWGVVQTTARWEHMDSAEGEEAGRA